MKNKKAELDDYIQELVYIELFDKSILHGYLEKSIYLNKYYVVLPVDYKNDKTVAFLKSCVKKIAYKKEEMSIVKSYKEKLWK